MPHNFKNAGRVGTRSAEDQHGIRSAIRDIKISRAIERQSKRLNKFEILPRAEASDHAANDSGFAAVRSGDTANRAIQSVGDENSAIRCYSQTAAHRKRIEFQIEFGAGCRAAISQRSWKSLSGKRRQFREGGKRVRCWRRIQSSS